MIRLIDVRSPEYALAFETLLRNLECAKKEEILQRIIRNRPRSAKAVDWGAVAGHTRMCASGSISVRRRAKPKAMIIVGSIQRTTLPDQVDLGLISHVYYHILDHKWAA